MRGFVSSLFTSKQETLPLPKGFGAEKGSGKEVISRNGLVSTYATEKLVTGPFRPALRDVSRQSTVEPGDVDAHVKSTFEAFRARWSQIFKGFGRNR